MRLLEMLTAGATGRRRLEDFGEPYSVRYERTGKVRDFVSDANEEYILRADVGVTFWANRAQLPDAIKVAERALIARLYEDVLADLPMLRLALHSGERNRALAIVDRIDYRLKNGSEQRAMEHIKQSETKA